MTEDQEKAFNRRIGANLRAFRQFIQALLAHLNVHQVEGRIVVIDPISDLARNLSTQLELRTTIEASNSRLEGPAFEEDVELSVSS